MKFTKTLVTSLITFNATFTYAMGVEEVCQKSAEIDVRLKRALIEDPSFLHVALETSVKNLSAKTKAAHRERVYFVYNRRDMPDQDLERLSFINCLIKFK